MKIFETIECPSCRQDKLIISKNTDTGKLYLYCSECFAAWNSIEEVSEKNRMFIDLDGNSEDPSYEEILANGWDLFVSRIVEV
ncbi:hypothetical protein IB269_05220 [Delftia sp. DLF01]|uniref:hypothetical protein n=1 Tax=Delftia sp. DLF01 TaxID=2769279 RepID=UPI0017865349|nr:hypothetical protein [Delftia sp. DLF01]MBD9580767.1 hypothetical protein [Delftia sp. DLF01]